MKKSRLLGAVCAGFCALMAITANAAAVQPLQARDLDGNPATIEAYYDPNLVITWAANANLLGETVLGFEAANEWAANLTISGIGGWRLPSMDVDGDGSVSNCIDQTGCLDNEYGFLYWYEGISYTTQSPFINITTGSFWSSTSNGSLNAWKFSFNSGFQDSAPKTSSQHAWAVQNGDIGQAVVPIPPALWLFGSGLLGLVGMARRKKAA